MSSSNFDIVPFTANGYLYNPYVTIQIPLPVLAKTPISFKQLTKLQIKKLLQDRLTHISVLKIDSEIRFHQCETICVVLVQEIFKDHQKIQTCKNQKWRECLAKFAEDFYWRLGDSKSEFAYTPPTVVEEIAPPKLAARAAGEDFRVAVSRDLAGPEDATSMTGIDGIAVEQTLNDEIDFLEEVEQILEDEINLFKKKSAAPHAGGGKKSALLKPAAVKLKGGGAKAAKPQLMSTNMFSWFFNTEPQGLESVLYDNVVQQMTP